MCSIQQALTIGALRACCLRLRFRNAEVLRVVQVVQMQHITAVYADTVRFVSEQEAPSEGGKTRSWHENGCLIAVNTQ